MIQKKRGRMKAFGKFNIEDPLPLRNFEKSFGIMSREGPNAWRSTLQSIQNLLNHLKRYTRSESSREKYLRTLLQFSKWTGLSPEKLVKLPKRRVELLVQEFADSIAGNNASPAYRLKSLISLLK
ncbi:MAG: hypothetical protein ACTSSJ_04155 [Candidatus Odinarchaeia archaeon]